MSTPEVTSYTCQKCGWADFHPISACPRCGGNIEQTPTSGKGKVVTYTAIRYPPKGFEKQAPYVVAVIDLKNGLRVVGRISNPANEVKIGSEVALTSSKEGTLEFRLSNGPLSHSDSV